VAASISFVHTTSVEGLWSLSLFGQPTKQLLESSVSRRRGGSAGSIHHGEEERFDMLPADSLGNRGHPG
jgi:hypothetical protein